MRLSAAVGRSTRQDRQGHRADIAVHSANERQPFLSLSPVPASFRRRVPDISVAPPSRPRPSGRPGPPLRLSLLSLPLCPPASRLSVNLHANPSAKTFREAMRRIGSGYSMRYGLVLWAPLVSYLKPVRDSHVLPCTGRVWGVLLLGWVSNSKVKQSSRLLRYSNSYP